MPSAKKPRRYGICRNRHSETSDHLWSLLLTGRIDEWIALNTAHDEDTGCRTWDTGLGKPGSKSAPEVQLPRVLPSPNWPSQNHVRAARLVWEIVHNARVPDGRMVYAKCLDKRCIAREHLVCGTKAGQGVLRAQAGKAKHSTGAVMLMTARRRARSDMTAEIAQAIRDHMDAIPKGQRTQQYAILAERYGVSTRRVELITQRKIWRPDVMASPFQGLFTGLTTAANDGKKRAA